MADVARAQRVLEAERNAVLDGFRDVAKRRTAEIQRHSDATWALEQEWFDLALRGKAAGVPVVEMADALGFTRQRMHHIIRQAEFAAETRSSKRRKERRDA
jgi:hypothetical protein